MGDRDRVAGLQYSLYACADVAGDFATGADLVGDAKQQKNPCDLHRTESAASSILDPTAPKVSQGSACYIGT